MIRRAPTLRRLLLALVLPLFVTACEDDEMLDLAKKVAFDPTSVEFTAERKFAVNYGGHQLEWLERVQSAGDGKTILVELLERNGLRRDQISDPAELAEFDRLAATLAAGGGPRTLFQRDPVPDDLGRMLANYQVSILDVGREPITPKGEPVLTYRIDPRFADRPFYLLTASTGHGREGFPVQCLEYVRGPTGPVLVSEMIVKSVQWKTSDIDAPESPVDSRIEHPSLIAARASAGRNGVTLFLPKNDALPYGFELARIEEVVLRTEATKSRNEKKIVVYRFVYSDGVEHIDLLEHTSLGTLPTAGHGISGPTMDVAFISRFGSIEIATLLHDTTQITVESRISSDRFEAMLRALVQL